MKADRRFPDACDFFLPCLWVGVTSCQGSLQAHAHSQRVLVLMRERDKTLVSQHLVLSPR